MANAKTRTNVDDVLARAGRNVVYGALSLTLATACAPLFTTISAARADDAPSGVEEGEPSPPDDPTSPDNPTSQDGAMSVVCLCAVGDDGITTTAEEGRSYFSGTFALMLSGAAAIDEDKTCVRMYDKDDVLVDERGVLAIKVEQGQTTEDALSEVTFGVGDGDYGRIEFLVWDVEERSAEATLLSVTIDTRTPEVRVDYPQGEATTTADACQYFNKCLEVPVCISDRHLDLARTTLCGHALEDLVEAEGEILSLGDGISCEEWECEVDEDGLVAYSTVLRFEDGSYTLPLVEATDKLGLRTSGPESLSQDPVRKFVVDTQAPTVKAQVRLKPATILEDDVHGVMAAFEGAFDLHVWADDEGGVASVVLDEQSRRNGMSLVAAPDGSGYAIEPAHGLFDETTSVRVCDLAGNERVWSMAPRGKTSQSGVTEEVYNEPIRDAEGSLLCTSGHPALLVADMAKPRVAVEGIEENETLCKARRVRINVSDDRWGYVACSEGERIIASLQKDGVVVAQCKAAYEGATTDDTSHTYALDIPASQDHADDGRYVLHVFAGDLVGRESEYVDRSFVVDTTPPVLEVTYADDEGPRDVQARAVARRHTVCMVVCEENYTAEELNKMDGPLKLTVTATEGGKVGSVSLGAWQQMSEPSRFLREIELCADGTYVVGIAGCDHAGNPLVGEDGTKVGAEGFTSPDLVVDGTAPKITYEVRSEPGDSRSHAGVDYYRHPITVRLCVVDRNFDERRSQATGPDGKLTSLAWERSKRGEDGNVTHTAEITYLEDANGVAVGTRTLLVRATDLASNKSDEGPNVFVVDQTAPRITSASVSKVPAETCVQAGDADPTLFFNEQDGSQTSLSISFMDEHLLDAAWVDDPEGVYNARTEDVRGKREGELVLTLEDPERYGKGQAGVFSRDVRVYVQDLSGNTRVWTIDRYGELVADHDTGSKNVSVDGLGFHPVALMSDATPPAIRMEGVEAGRYYNTPQHVLVTIEERSFEYLRQFDPKRAIVRCTRREAEGAEGETTWFVTADHFVGGDAVYSFDQKLSLDGRYELRAQFDDIAKNPSPVVGIGSFVVDSTPPKASVTWDNNDVHNGRYFRTPRVATVIVVERNFDSSLVRIRTTGTVGGWSSQGDTHTCVVRFESDASDEHPHTLSVEGADRAGNQMETVTEADFVIDTQVPTVSLARRVSDQDPFVASADETALADKSAFAEAVVPIVDFYDDANLDASNCVMSLRAEGADLSNDSSVVSHTEVVANTHVRAWWDNLGLDSRNDGTYYQMSADGIYRLSAQAADLAGNTSAPIEVTFSVNRYGSNYFLENVEGGVWNEEELGRDTLLTDPPRIVVHEVNVCGMATEDKEGKEECVVTKEHAHATSRIARTSQRDTRGYVLERVHAEGESADAEGWCEYVYDIAAGNFGKGSDSDQGDGGQGNYRVDISSTDLAGNRNTTAQYWDPSSESDDGAGREDSDAGMPKAKEATVSFTLDEDGPVVEDLEVPRDMWVGKTCRASFRLVDQITNGDKVRVLVNGEPVSLYREGDTLALKGDELLMQGTYWFDIQARPVFFAQDVRIEVEDYTGLESRRQTVRMDGIRVTTLLWEAALVSVVLGLVFGLAVLWNRLLKGAGKEGVRTRRAPNS